jgi:hypothetical protein
LAVAQTGKECMSMSNESEDKPLEDADGTPLTQDEPTTELTSTPATEANAAPTETETAVDPIVAEDKPVHKKAPAPRKKRKPSSRARQKNQSTLRQVTARFAACGRCSYFWAGYRVIVGEEALKTAVAQSQSGWLSLEWNLQMPELVHKSYGVRLDITHFHYEGCCKECRRPFVYQASDSEDVQDSFEIGMTPRVSQKTE